MYDTRHHLGWAPTYRKWILKENVGDTVRQLFEMFSAARDYEIEKMKGAEDHVNIFTSIPPRYFVGQIVRAFKGINAKEIFLRHPEVKKALCGEGFWEGDYSVRTVGDKVTSKTTKRYIRSHRHEKKTPKQLEFGF